MGKILGIIFGILLGAGCLCSLTPWTNFLTDWFFIFAGAISSVVIFIAAIERLGFSIILISFGWFAICINAIIEQTTRSILAAVGATVFLIILALVTKSYNKTRKELVDQGIISE